MERVDSSPTTVLQAAWSVIHGQLLSQGYAVIDDEELTVSTGQWRMLARSSAREMGRPLKFAVVHDRLFAVLTDWPRAGETRAYPPEIPGVHSGDDFLRRLAKIKARTSHRPWLPEGPLG